MTRTAKALFFDMNIRLKMQREGITSPPQAIRDLARTLVDKLSQLDPAEPIEVSVDGKRLRYIRVRTGEVLAEIDHR